MDNHESHTLIFHKVTVARRARTSSVADAMPSSLEGLISILQRMAMTLIDLQ